MLNLQPFFGIDSPSIGICLAKLTLQFVVRYTSTDNNTFVILSNSKQFILAVQLTLTVLVIISVNCLLAFIVQLKVHVRIYVFFCFLAVKYRYSHTHTHTHTRTRTHKHLERKWVSPSSNFFTSLERAWNGIVNCILNNTLYTHRPTL